MLRGVTGKSLAGKTPVDSTCVFYMCVILESMQGGGETQHYLLCHPSPIGPHTLSEFTM